ncbi:MAG: S9 family peptidase [Pirellulaceae bacterium]|nr:S9 family peptidase [Pirellulaceae bacterium]
MRTSSLFIILPLIILSFPLRTSAADSAPDPRRPAAIETEEVPPVPAELQARLAQYQNLRAAGFAGWDPAGRGILIRTRFGNSLQLHRVYEPGGRREQITFFDEPVDGGFIPGTKDEEILLSMSSGGNENTQVYFLDRKSFQTSLLTDGKSRCGINVVREDGSQMVISTNQRNGRDTDLFLADPRKPASLKMLMQTDKEFWFAADWSLDGKTLLLTRTVSANESYPALLDIDSGKRTELPRVNEEKASYGPMAFTPSGEFIYIVADAEGEFSQLYRRNQKSGEYQNLTPDIPWDVNGLEIDSKTGQVAFSVNEDGASKVFLISKGEAPEPTRRELKLPLGIVSSLEFSPDSKHLGFTLARPDAPADAYSVKLETGELTRWTFSEVGGLNPASFVTPTRIRFKSFDDREIPAHVYRPKNASAKPKAPVLINIHGGPEGQAQPYFTGATQFYVNELGIAVIYPNVRGTSGYGKTYLKLDNAEKREDSVKDIGALLDWIATQEDLDASRVAVTGGSYGGYMVLASLVHYPDRIKAGVDAVGIANFITFLEKTSAYRQDLRRVEYGDERDPKMRAIFERISPANSAEKIRSDLLVVHGKNDPRVPFAEAQQIAEKVRSQNRPVWTVYAANEGHGFGKKENVDYLRAVEVMFLKKSFGIE